MDWRNTPDPDDPIQLPPMVIIGLAIFVVCLVAVGVISGIKS